ncbi:hypothetical protein AVL48_30730, partial [Amycolatopsis regifaucium]
MQVGEESVEIEREPASGPAAPGRPGTGHAVTVTVDLVLLQHRAQCSGQQRNPTGQLGQGFQVGSVGGRVVVIEPLADLVGEDVGEKFWSWTEPGGDLHRVITRDELL